MTVHFKKLPGVLSFQRLVIISDGLFFNLHEDGSETPLSVIRHGIRGTQNVNGNPPKNVNNIQITETAKSASDATAALVRFSMSFVPLSKALFSCAGEESGPIREALDEYVERASQSEGLRDVANRYARNILNGRWLWRNRILGSAIEVGVSVDNEKQQRFNQNALTSRLKDFEEFAPDELGLGALIQEVLEGSATYRFNIQARIDFGFKGSVEVFPSQNYVQNKPDGFARPLYKVDVVRPKYSNNPSEFEDIQVVGQAALRDQKIGNALRTIDTWYPDFADHGQPIPVEPLGASLDAQKFFREKKDTSFKIMCGVTSLDPNSDDGRFLIASLIRGGVYSESDKSSSGAKKDKTTVAAGTEEGDQADEA